MASYCDARKNNGTWLLRIDDIDPPRSIPNAIELIQASLSNYGFQWDDTVHLQSERSNHYRRQLLKLNEKQLLFPCECSRSKLSGHQVYPGYCNPSSAGAVLSPSEALRRVANKINTPHKAHDKDYSIRISIDSVVWFEDGIQGEQVFNNDVLGDTIVVRRDALFSYALACALDDADGITHVVRGCDLLGATASQIAIMKRLSLKPPRYAHIPIAISGKDQKLSKQTLAHALDTLPALPTLLNAWQFLGQAEIKADSIQSFWTIATESWQLDKVPRTKDQISPV